MLVITSKKNTLVGPAPKVNTLHYFEGTWIILKKFRGKIPAKETPYMGDIY